MSNSDKAWDEESGDEDDVAIVKQLDTIVEGTNGVLNDSLTIAPVQIVADDDDEDESDAESIIAASAAETEAEEDAHAEEITLDLETTTGEQALLKFASHYADVTPEFADVEIFLISADSLLIELTAHSYHNWTLGGQTLVLTTQIDRFLSLLGDRGGRFKFIWFSDLTALYADDPVLAFLRSVVAHHLLQSKWADEIETFISPIDPKWDEYLATLTPSFLLLSPDDPSPQFNRITNNAFKQRFVSLALGVLKKNIPVVEFVGLTLNISHVNASRVAPASINYLNWESYLMKTWSVEPKNEPQRVGAVGDVSGAASVAEFWGILIKANLGNQEMPAERFDCLCSAVLLAALVAENRGPSRSYMEDEANKEAKIDVIRGRRLLLTAATRALDSSSSALPFKVADCWDGRLVASIFDALSSNKEVLPFRLQEKFAKLHDGIGLKHPLAMDSTEKLLDPFMVEKEPLINGVELAPIDLPLLKTYAPELDKLFKAKATTGKDYGELVDTFVQRHAWRPERVIAEDYNKTADKVPDKPLDIREERRRRRNQQIMSRWYEFFAQSLEGRGSSLLVDFARVPRGFASITAADEGDVVVEEEKKKGKQQHGKSGKKAPVISKKEAILANIKTDKNKKRTDGELQMIKFATQQKNAIPFLENLMSKLELEESKALCVFEQSTRLMRDLADTSSGPSNLEQRRTDGIKLVGKLKELCIEHAGSLDERQKERVTEMWVQLGFEKSTKKRYADDKKMSMDMNIIDYQLAVAGELIDIQSDPVKDDRVTGFHPDAWQRKMLDVVDKFHSALIIAPTSAGKTFVSYYCIEKILRQSDDDIVIYVSPTKALVNQVAGSIYARFRNKTMSGGKTLFGVYTRDFSENVLNSQVLITVPECLDILLMSANATSQEWCSRIKYVIFDEVHCIGSQSNVDTSAVVWEHVLLMIPCPFLALSATIGNPEALHQWLQAAENSKPAKRPVKLIKYDERYSELELAIQQFDDRAQSNGILKLNPFGVYVPEKLKIFGIPADQQLTARQIYDLYHAMAEEDAATKDELEPAKYFKLEVDKAEKVWLARKDLRRYERALKTRFLEWLKADRDKMLAVLGKLGAYVSQELEYRAKPFEQRPTALEHIVPLIEHLRDRHMLPCICFNEDRRICERLAQQLHDEFAQRQREFEESAEFRQNYLIKDEAKILKQQKRQRDASKKKTAGRKDEDGVREKDEDAGFNREEDGDPLVALKMRAREALAKFRLSGRGKDPELYRKVVERLTKKDGMKESTKLLLLMLDRGIGYHHAGMSTVQRQSVEILYRSGHLAVVFSTSTLALGINMPCKTVIFGIDSHQLSPLLFRQMSGRAGRRGFDTSGTVVFMSLPTSKIRRLLTASLSNLRGNIPFTTSFILRLLTLVTHFEGVENLPKAVKKQGESTKEAAVTLLRNSFVKFTSADRADRLGRQSQLLFGFSAQLLRRMGLMNEKGAPTGLSNIVTHLHYHEPGNLVFVYLLQKGAFHRLCDQLSGPPLREMIVRILAHLFTRTILPRNWTPETKSNEFRSSKVFMEPLPQEFEKLVSEYNSELTGLFKAFLQQMNDNKSLQGETFALAGRSDAEVDVLAGDIIKPFDDSITFDENLLPTFAYPFKDHRGRPILLNAYACDFYNTESRRAITTENGILESDIWNLLNDFQLTLSEIAAALKLIGRSTDKVSNVMEELSAEYSEKFRRAFGMKMRH